MSTLNVTTLKTSTIQNSSAVTALSIDSTGYVTRGQNIAFKVYRTVGDVTYTGTGSTTESTIVWDTVGYNLGNGYSTTTGRFTAPVTGVYSFGYHLYRQTSSGNYSRMWFRTSTGMNPAYMICQLSSTAATSWNMQSTVLLQANDYIYCNIQTDVTTNFYFAEDHSFFYGFLVG